ncbi:MAG: glutathione S-transferase N-terminal domain-containing protein [Proteobacteria bacterium]|nr:glutathione S-transferase N-terminal domain-containing protein [Pseudomonadota bacterium]
MIDLYTDTTPNGFRAALILEETGFAYCAHRVDTQKGEQHAPDFKRLNPAEAIPVIVDHDGPSGQPITITQSGAIVLYAARKAGRLIPSDVRRHAYAMQWFMQIATDITSSSSWIFNHATAMPERSAANAVWMEARLLKALSVADGWLAEHEFFADELSVADVLLYPNFAFRKAMLEKANMCSHLRRWGETMAARPSVQRGMSIFKRAETSA